jgi:ankyrin repeat protein
MVRKQPKRKERPGVDEYGRTPLHYAAVEGRDSDVARLLAKGANPNAQDDDGWTPLHCAAQSISAKAAQALLAAGANTELKDSYGNTPLWRAVMASKGNGAVIVLLRQHSADAQASNLSGITPVTLARTIANYDVAQFFSDLA